MTEAGRPARRRRWWLGDDVAYMLPIAAFLLLTQAGIWWPSLYPISYVAKTVLTAGLLVALRPHYTKIRWRHAWLGAVFGVIGVAQWIGMEKLLLHLWPQYPRPSVEPFDPYRQIASPALRLGFLGVRLAGAALVVPVIEELFWRDFAWRTTLAPGDFKLAEIGEPDWKAWLLVSLLFGAVHVQWMTAVVWGMMIGALLVRTRSLGACIIMHGVTNLLLGLYVLRYKEWAFW